MSFLRRQESRLLKQSLTFFGAEKIPGDFNESLYKKDNNHVRIDSPKGGE
jgi:hypothetical protein